MAESRFKIGDMVTHILLPAPYLLKMIVVDINGNKYTCKYYSRAMDLIQETTCSEFELITYEEPKPGQIF